MRHVIEAGTDASSLLLFDPGALPGDFERWFQSGSVEILERLTREGRTCWITTDGDGGYSLHAYVDERVPRELERCAVELETIEEFHVPTGRLVFAGSEYAFREDDGFLRNHPHMGGSFLVQPGVYRLRLFRTQYPKHLVEQLFRNQASSWEYCLWMSMILLIPLAVAAWIGLVVIFFTTVHVPFPSFLAPLLGLVFAAPFLVRRLETYRLAKERFTSLEREHPALVAQLESCARTIDRNAACGSAVVRGRRVRCPLPEPACTRPTFTGTGRAFGREKEEACTRRALRRRWLHRKRLRPFGYRLLNEAAGRHTVCFNV